MRPLPASAPRTTTWGKRNAPAAPTRARPRKVGCCQKCQQPIRSVGHSQFKGQIYCPYVPGQLPKAGTAAGRARREEGSAARVSRFCVCAPCAALRCAALRCAALRCAALRCAALLHDSLHQPCFFAQGFFAPCFCTICVLACIDLFCIYIHVYAYVIYIYIISMNVCVAFI